MRSNGLAEQPIRVTLRVDLITNCFDCTFTCGYVGADATSPLTRTLHPCTIPQSEARPHPTPFTARRWMSQATCGTLRCGPFYR